MNYDIILVDVFNLYYRKKNDRDLKLDAIEQSANCVKYINSDIRTKLTENGYLYLLYDPIIKDDLGFNKKFMYTSVRREMDPGYKANRHHSIDVQEAVRQIMNYYKYRGDHILNVASPNLEADDFVEQIIEKEKQHWEKEFPGKKCRVALFTTDMDWARYLSSGEFEVSIINDTFDNPFTKTSYKEKYGYVPTVASVTLDKAMFGDTSDNIIGCLKLKKAKFIQPDVEGLAKDIINNVAESGESLKSFTNRFLNYKVCDLLKKTGKTDEETLFLAMGSSIGKDDPLDAFKMNLRVIKSRCKNIDDHITWNKENQQMIDVVERVLNLKKSEQKFKFGNVKIK